MQPFRLLIDKTIIKVERVHDYIQLYFNNSSILNVYCDFHTDGVINDISELEGKKVIDIFDEQNAIHLKLSHNHKLEVFYENCLEPEALELIDKDGKITIFP